MMASLAEDSEGGGEKRRGRLKKVGRGELLTAVGASSCVERLRDGANTRRPRETGRSLLLAAGNRGAGLLLRVIFERLRDVRYKIVPRSPDWWFESLPSFSSATGWTFEMNFAHRVPRPGKRDGKSCGLARAGTVQVGEDRDEWSIRVESCCRRADVAPVPARERTSCCPCRRRLLPWIRSSSSFILPGYYRLRRPCCPRRLVPFKSSSLVFSQAH